MRELRGGHGREPGSDRGDGETRENVGSGPAASPDATQRDPGNGEAPGPTRVVIVDDHLLFAESLAIVIDQTADLSCVGIAGTIAEGVEVAARTQPDVILLDVGLPDGDGTQAIPLLRERSPESRILVMTGQLEAQVFTRAARAGAAGFLRKEGPVSNVIRSIHAARQGEVLVEQATLTAMLAELRSDGAQPDRAGGVHLTAREIDVLALMGEGLDPHAIAERLHISLNTCRGYQKSILAKLEAHSQLEAVVTATRRGLLRPPSA